MNDNLRIGLKITNFLFMGVLVIYMLLMLIGFIATGDGEYKYILFIETFLGGILALSFFANKKLNKKITS
jgi:hypothetical protein